MVEIGSAHAIPQCPFKEIYWHLQVKSVLDPCEDDNEENPDESVSLGADSARSDDSSESGSEVVSYFPFY